MREVDLKARDCARRTAELIGVDDGIPDEKALSQQVNVLLAGQPQQNLFGVLNSVLGGLGALDRHLNRGYRCSVNYGDKQECFMVKDCERIEVTEQTLAEMLSTMDQVNSTHTACEIYLPNPMLKGIRINVMASAEDYEDVEWDKLSMQMDVCCFTLTATALLSMCERTALRRGILPDMTGFVGAVATQYDLILDNDKESVENSLESFFQGKVPVFRLPDTDTDMLKAALADLTGRKEELARAREARTSALLLKKAGNMASMQIDAISADGELLEEAVQLVTEKTKALPARQEAACRRARMRYTSGMKIEVTTEISSFNQKLREQMKADIENSDNIEELQELLPRYISDLWNQELENTRRMISTAVSNMAEGLGDYIAKDIREYITDGANAEISGLALTVSDLYSKPDTIDGESFNFELSKDKTNIKKYGAIASGVALILLSHPIIGLTVAVFGSRYFKKEEHARFLQTNKQALLSAAGEMCDKAYDEAVTALDKSFAFIESELSNRIENCYQKVLSSMIKALNKHKGERDSFVQRLSILKALRDEINAVTNECRA